MKIHMGLVLYSYVSYVALSCVLQMIASGNCRHSSTIHRGSARVIESYSLFLYIKSKRMSYINMETIFSLHIKVQYIGDDIGWYVTKANPYTYEKELVSYFGWPSAPYRYRVPFTSDTSASYCPYLSGWLYSYESLSALGDHFSWAFISLFEY